MTAPSLENLAGDLRTAYKLTQPGSMLHVDELTKERRTNEELRSPGFYTADGELYFLKGKNEAPTLVMTRGSVNPLLLDSTIDAYCDQLLQQQNYRPTTAEFQRAIKDKDTKLFDLAKLKLQRYNDEFSFVEVSSTAYRNLNAEQRLLAERVFGRKKDFAASMKLLETAGISTTRIYVLSSEYVKSQAVESPIGRASWLYGFSDGSSFDADGRSVNGRDRVRGVRRASEASRTPEGRAPENGGVAVAPVAASEVTPALCYDTLLANPQKAIAALDSDKAARLSRLLADYLATRV